jgi:hypothetical protein
MKKIITLIIAAIVAVMGSSFGQDLDEVLQQYYEVTGADKVANLQTMTTKGKILQGGIEMEFTNIIKRPGKLYVEVPLQGQVLRQGYDGEVAWMVAPWSGSLDPIELTDVQLSSMERQSDMDGTLYNYEEKGYTTTLEGEEDLEGSPIYLIKQVNEKGDIFLHHIDADNFVNLMTKAILKVQGSTIEVETYLSNFKPVEEIIMPFSIESKVDGQTQSHIVVEEYIFDEPVNDSIFEKPAPAPKPEVEEGEE